MAMRTNYNRTLQLWMYLTNIMVTESSQTQNKTHWMIPFPKHAHYLQCVSQTSKEGSKGWRLWGKGDARGLLRGWLSVQLLYWELANWGLCENSLSYAFCFLHFLFGYYISIKQLLKQTEDWHSIWPGISGPWNIFRRNSCMGALRRGMHKCSQDHCVEQSTGNDPQVHEQENRYGVAESHSAILHSRLNQGIRPWGTNMDACEKPPCWVKRASCRRIQRIQFIISTKLCKTPHVV